MYENVHKHFEQQYMQGAEKSNGFCILTFSQTTSELAPLCMQNNSSS